MLQDWQYSWDTHAVDLDENTLIDSKNNYCQGVIIDGLSWPSIPLAGHSWAMCACSDNSKRRIFLVQQHTYLKWT